MEIKYIIVEIQILIDKLEETSKIVQNELKIENKKEKMKILNNQSKSSNIRIIGMTRKGRNL